MGRKPTTQLLPDGSCSTRVVIPRPVMLMIQALAKEIGVDDEAALRMFMHEISAHVLANDTGDFLGPVWGRAVKRAHQDNFGVLDGPPIDFGKIQRSTKTKSGFVGVYANGAGFRAMARVNNVETYVGTFDTAEQAAWRRYLHYKENQLPYGELEADIAVWRARGEQGTDREIAIEIVRQSRTIGTYHIYEQAAIAMGIVSADGRILSDSPRRPTAAAPKAVDNNAVKAADEPESTDVAMPSDTSHLINEPHDYGMVNELVPIGFDGGLPPTFDDDYKPERR